MGSTEWLTVAEAARILGDVSAALIYRLFKKGELEGVKVAGRVKLRASSVNEYLERCSNRKIPGEIPAISRNFNMKPPDNWVQCTQLSGAKNHPVEIDNNIINFGTGLGKKKPNVSGPFRFL